MVTSPDMPTTLRLIVSPSICVFSFPNSCKQEVDNVFRVLLWIK
jgi:hypothetical protein